MKRILAIKDSRLEALELKVQQHVSPLISFSLKIVNKYLGIDAKMKLAGRESYPTRTRPHKRTKNQHKVFAIKIE
jgi:hypothetical protein